MGNYTMVTDLYELTTAQTYFNSGREKEITYFDAFFRKIPFEGGYAVMGGAHDIVNYIKNLKFTKRDIKYLRSLNLFTEEFLKYLSTFKFHGDIFMIPDGTVIFENEPLVTVRASVIEAQIIETTLLAYLNAEIKFTTAARRMVDAAGEIPIMEFGARRADGPEAAILASKCGYIGGCIATSNCKVGLMHGTPVMGTHPHSMITDYDNEYEAFLSYAKTHPYNTVFLVDTYDTLRSGIPNAIKVARDYLIPNGYPFKGIRIDSGDLAYLSKEARRMLDEAGFPDTKICLSNGLTPETIKSLKEQGAVIDSIGAGDNIASPKERVGCVYKLVAKEENNKIVPKIKISGDAIKVVNPGYKKVYRFYDKKTGYAIGDVVALHDEVIPQDKFTLIDPNNKLNQKEIGNYRVRELQKCYFKDGKLIEKIPNINQVREYCSEEMDTLYEEVRRLENPHDYYVDLTNELLELKEQLIKEHRENIKVKSIGGLHG